MSQALLVVLSGTTFLLVSCSDGSSSSVQIAGSDPSGRPTVFGTAPIEEPLDPVQVPQVLVEPTDVEAGASPVPEPMTMLLLGSGLVAVGFVGRRRRHSELAQEEGAPRPRLRVVSK